MKYAVFAAVAGTLVLAGCQTEPMRNMQADLKTLFGTTKGGPALAAGLRQYEDGNYAEAARKLQPAIDRAWASPTA